MNDRMIPSFVFKHRAWEAIKPWLQVLVVVGLLVSLPGLLNETATLLLQDDMETGVIHPAEDVLNYIAQPLPEGVTEESITPEQRQEMVDGLQLQLDAFATSATGFMREKGWMLLTAGALEGDPKLSTVAPYVADSGEGRWTVAEALELNVPAPVITQAMIARLQQLAAHAYVRRVLGRRLVRLKRLRLFLHRKRNRMAAEGQIHRRPDRQRAGDHLRRAHGVSKPQVRGNQVLKGEHRADVRRRGRRAQKAGRQHADVAVHRIGEQQQHQRGQHVALVHLAAEGENQQKRRARGKQQGPPALALHVDEDAEGKGRDHQRHAQRAVGHGAKDHRRSRHPVAAQQEHEVAGGERRIVVA